MANLEVLASGRLVHPVVFRVDHENLVPRILEEGLRASSAVNPVLGLKGGVPVETAEAEFLGLPVPPPELMFAPRLYFFTSLEEARRQRLLMPWMRVLAFRLPEGAPFFPDGLLWPKPSFYLAFPGLREWEVCVPAQDIFLLE